MINLLDKWVNMYKLHMGLMYIYICAILGVGGCDKWGIIGFGSKILMLKSWSNFGV